MFLVRVVRVDVFSGGVFCGSGYRVINEALSMNILGLINKDSGPGFHRIMMPLLMMPDTDVYITNVAAEADVDKADIIFYNRVCGEQLHAYANQHGKQIVVDIDDWWELDYHHVSYGLYKEQNFASLQIKHIEQADLVTTTHERLQAKIKPYNERCIVLHNSIPNHKYFDTERTKSVLPRIFWQGSITHEQDIALLRGPMRRLQGCATVIAGYTKHDIWGKMVNNFTNGLTLPGAVLPGLPPHEYYRNYGSADICVAPLLDTAFNAMKSNLKVLEAAYSRLPIVCSKVDPYLDLPVLYAEKQTDWFKHLNMLIHDKSARVELGQRLYKYCNENYNFDKINQDRYDRFTEAIRPDIRRPRIFQDA